jgi:FkbM family methyltransferase
MWRTAFGVVRSLRIYYGHPARARAMDRLYAQFIATGDLVFDIGAHVGDRIASFRRLDASVLAVEPQPALHRTLRLLYGRDRRVTLVSAAVGREAGTSEMKINPCNPTISTLSEAFIVASRGADGWRGESWSRTQLVPITTLDALIDAHGRPAFIKLDVEGFEAEALKGLSTAVPALSFEFTTIQREVALACLERCAKLGYTEFNSARGESQTLGAWRDPREMAVWLASLPHEANSGDIYARLPVGGE